MIEKLENAARHARVVSLIDQAWWARCAGKMGWAAELVAEAIELDSVGVSVIGGAMAIGAIPNPETEPAAWQEYVDAAKGAAESGRMMDR